MTTGIICCDTNEEPDMPHPTIISALKQIAAGISEMNTAFPHRKFA
jgi:hypothetical protein